MSRKVLAGIVGLSLMFICAGCDTNAIDSAIPRSTDPGPDEITAVIDETPTLVMGSRQAAIRVVVIEPVARGFKLGEVVAALVSAQNVTLSKGTSVKLTCSSLSAYERNCDLVIVATPTPPIPQ